MKHRNERYILSSLTHFIRSTALLLIPIALTGQTQVEMAGDSLAVASYYPSNPYEITLQSDTALDLDFYRYDPGRKNFYATLGNFGSSAYPLIFSPDLHAGFHPGLPQFDIYKYPGRDIRFYRLQNAYTHLFVNQQTQDNLHLDIRFARNFERGSNLSLNYSRINQLGMYRNQRLRNTNLGVGFTWQSGGGQYRGFLSYASNEILNQQNGGITSEELLNSEDGDNREVIDVKLDGASTRDEERWISLLHYLRLSKQSANETQNTLRASHRLDLVFGKYKYTDEFDDFSYSTDSAFYEDFLIDNRGVFHFLRYRSVQNQFSLQLDRFEGSHRTDWLHLGLGHQYWYLDHIEHDDKFHEVFLFGSWQKRLLRHLSLRAQGKFHLLENRGDFNLDAEMVLDLQNAGVLTGIL
jgi:hypothetical protein